MIAGDLRRLSSYSLLVHLLHFMIGFFTVEGAQGPVGPGQNFWLKIKNKDEKKKRDTVEASLFVSKYYVHSLLVDLFSSWATCCDKLVLCEMNELDTLRCNLACL